MAHIDVDPKLPGIVGLLKAYPESAQVLSALAEVILRGDSGGMSMAERELIAGFVSRLNECEFCSLSHAGVAEHPLARPGLIDDAVCDLEQADLPAKMTSLLRIAAKVRADAREVSADDIDAARAAGADDRDIHDAVLIAAAFCMFNRYVDGLGTAQPQDKSFYRQGVDRTVAHGYLKLLEFL